MCARFSSFGTWKSVWDNYLLFLSLVESFRSFRSIVLSRDKVPTNKVTGMRKYLLSGKLIVCARRMRDWWAYSLDITDPPPRIVMPEGLSILVI